MTNPIEPLQWLSMIASFVLVIGLLFATLWVLRRLGGRSLRGAGGRISIVESMWLAPRQRLAVVRVDQQELLVAITQQQISLLTVLSPVATESQSGLQAEDSGPSGHPEEGASAAPPIGRPAPDAAVSERFRQALRAWTQRGSAGGGQS